MFLVNLLVVGLLPAVVPCAVWADEQVSGVAGGLGARGGAVDPQPAADDLASPAPELPGPEGREPDPPTPYSDLQTSDEFDASKSAANGSAPLPQNAEAVPAQQSQEAVGEAVVNSTGIEIPSLGWVFTWEVAAGFGLGGERYPVWSAGQDQRGTVVRGGGVDLPVRVAIGGWDQDLWWLSLDADAGFAFTRALRGRSHTRHFRGGPTVMAGVSVVGIGLGYEVARLKGDAQRLFDDSVVSTEFTAHRLRVPLEICFNINDGVGFPCPHGATVFAVRVGGSLAFQRTNLPPGGLVTPSRTWVIGGGVMAALDVPFATFFARVDMFPKAELAGNRPVPMDVPRLLAVAGYVGVQGRIGDFINYW